MQNKKMSDLENGQDHRVNICNGPSRQQISTSIKVNFEHFSLAVFSIYSRFKMRDFEYVGQGHDVQHSQ